MPATEGTQATAVMQATAATQATNVMPATSNSRNESNRTANTVGVPAKAWTLSEVVKKQQHAERPTTVRAQLTSGMTAAEATIEPLTEAGPQESVGKSAAGEKPVIGSRDTWQYLGQ